MGPSPVITIDKTALGIADEGKVVTSYLSFRSLHSGVRPVRASQAVVPP
jgi:hypothetical protein